jgi:hypothetical protein
MLPLRWLRVCLGQSIGSLLLGFPLATASQGPQASFLARAAAIGGLFLRELFSPLTQSLMAAGLINLNGAAPTRGEGGGVGWDEFYGPINHNQ